MISFFSCSIRCLSGPTGTLQCVPPEILQASPLGGLDMLLSWIGNDAAATDPRAMEQQLQQAGILIPEEYVAMSFKAGRDSLIMTTKRILMIDVQGFTGRRIEYKSVPYTSVRAFSVESAGTFDTDAELLIYTRNHWYMDVVRQDLRSGKADIMAIQKHLSRHVFGDFDSTSGHGQTRPPELYTGSSVSVSGFLGWLGDDSHQISSADVEAQLRQQTPLLLPEETVDLAFKCGRDMCVYTSMRIIFIDVQGWTGKRVEYESVPLKFCTGFEIVTAGGMLDRDAEVYVFEDVPAKARISQDLRKGKCDVFMVQKMLAAKLLLAK